MNKKPFLLLTLLIFLALVLGCSKKSDYEISHKFNDNIWKRFNILRFEIPIEKEGRSYDISFFASFTREFEYDNLGINMIMTTPSGEERIKEYDVHVKSKDGRFTGTFTGDSFLAVIPLKKNILISQKGILKIDMENLVPRLETRGILRVGIRLHPLD